MYTGTHRILNNTYKFVLNNNATFNIYDENHKLTFHRNKRDVYWSMREHDYSQNFTLTNKGHIMCNEHYIHFQTLCQTRETYDAFQVELGSNLYVMFMYVNCKFLNISTNLSKLSDIYHIDTNTIHSLYRDIISLHNSIKSKSGEIFENIIADVLDSHHITYKRQVGIDKYGVIRNLSMNKSTIGCLSFVDFVIGKNVELNAKISDYIVISAKTTCRERWKQDFMKLCPRKFLLVTMSTDYPNKDKFCDSSVRKIVTSCKKGNEVREYVLSFDQLINEINSL